MVLPEDLIAILLEKLVALEEFFNDLPEGGDDCLIAVLRIVPLLVETHQCLLK